MGQSKLQLEALVNPEDITRLVIFDTWTLNCDRHFYDTTARRPNPDNVFLSKEGVEAGKRRLIAMDHGLCFIRSGEDLSPKLAHIEKIQDKHIYGLFPEFRKRLRQNIIDDCVLRLQAVGTETVEAMIRTIPKEWEVSIDTKKAWIELIYRRARFVADNFQNWIDTVAP